MTARYESAVATIRAYLRAEEDERLDDLLALFADSAVVRNAANPADVEPGAVRRFAEDFWSRTTARSFELLEVAEADGHLFAMAEGRITFRAGVAFGSVTATKDFATTLPFALHLTLDDAGLITALDVVHETTSVLRLAASTADG